MDNYYEFKKEVTERANNFFKSKPRSLNLTSKTYVDNYIDILRTHRLCILDTETTGLNPSDKLWQISIRVLENLIEVDELYETFKPAVMPEYRDNDKQYNRYKETDGLDLMPLDKINDFLKKYDNAVIVAHNISFDIPHCESEGIVFPENDYFYDTMWTIKNTIVSMSKFSVFCKVNCESNKQHDASYDTRLLRDCVVYWLNNYIKPVKFNGSKYLHCIVEYLQKPSSYKNPNDKSQYSEFEYLTQEDLIDELKKMNYTIKHNKEFINLTESFYRVIINKTSCYIEYNYTGEDIDKTYEDGVNLPLMSEEQELIVRAIAEDNVTVDAVAGSGKTTTAMFIAREYPDKKILMLTYNKQLQVDSKRKCSSLKNIDVYTFHGYAGHIYNCSCHNDKLMDSLIKKEPIKSVSYDIIIVDEAQDLIDVYYNFVCKLDKVNNKSHKLMIVGDKYQNIYKFNGATAKYLENPEKYFNKTFTHLSLHMSYRLTNQMSQWLNNDVMHNDRIKTCKNGKPVNIIINSNNYISADIAGKYFAKKITEMYNSNVDVNDIMIISPVLGTKTVSKCIQQIKSNTSFDVFVPSSDDYQIDRSCCKDKIVFSSIHQSKGIERKYVFLFMFDTGYCYTFKEYLYELNNLFYVGLTRASNELTVFIRNIKFNTNDGPYIAEPFRFVNLNNIDKSYVNYVEKFNTIELSLTEDMITDKRHENVTKLCKFIKLNTELELNKIINIKTLETKRISCNIPHIICKEEVSEITGLAIAAMLGIKHDSNSIHHHIMKMQSTISSASKDNIFKVRNNHQFCAVSDIMGRASKMTIKQMLKLMTFHEFCDPKKRFVHKPLQLGNSGFNWINDEQADLLLKTTEENFKKHNISLDGAYEYDVGCRLEGFKDKSCWRDKIIIDDVYNISGIEGRVDLISGCDYMIEESDSSNNFNQTLTTQGTVIEFKAVNELKINHICQTLLYAFMMNQTHGILYNIKTGEMLRVSCDNEELFMKLMLDNNIEDN